MSDAEKLGEPSLWLGEPDRVLCLALGKLGEELSELAAIKDRVVIQGLAESDPETQKANRLALMEELADVDALWEVVVEEIGITPEEREAMNRRARRKYSHKKKWLAMVRNHLAQANTMGGFP